MSSLVVIQSPVICSWVIFQGKVQPAKLDSLAVTQSISNFFSCFWGKKTIIIPEFWEFSPPSPQIYLLLRKKFSICNIQNVSDQIIDVVYERIFCSSYHDIKYSFNRAVGNLRKCRFLFETIIFVTPWLVSFNRKETRSFFPHKL